MEPELQPRIAASILKSISTTPEEPFSPGSERMAVTSPVKITPAESNIW
jgi:hypothetical protein